jgi:prevent-host-death family protein
MDANQKGAIAEMKIAIAAIELGIPVLKPMTERGRYDLGLEIGGRILRVQCKWGALDEAEAVITVNLQTYSLTFSGHRRASYTEEEIDLLAVYCGGLDRCYLLPSALVAGRRQISLRLVSALNGQRACVNLAADFEFSGAVAQLEERDAGSVEARGSSPLSSTVSPEPTGVMQMGANEFRNRFGYYMERAAAGDEILVTRHHRALVRVTPAQPPLTPA